MTTTLSTTTYKAVKAVYFPASKFPKPLRDFPVMSHVKLSQQDGRMIITALTWDEKKQAIELVTESIPARVEQEFETCIPARAFRDWLHATLPTKEEKIGGDKYHKYEVQQLNFTFDPAVEIVTIKVGNTRAQFKCISAKEFPA